MEDRQDALGAGLATPEQHSKLHPGHLAPLGTHRNERGDLNEPQNDEAPGLQAEGFKEQREADSADSEASQAVDQADADGKRFATLRAQLALKGYSLQVLPKDGYLIARWDRTLHCRDLECVSAFQARLGDAA